MIMRYTNINEVVEYTISLSLHNDIHKRDKEREKRVKVPIWG